MKYITKRTTSKFISTFAKETQKFKILVISESTESFTPNSEKPLEQRYLLNVEVRTPPGKCHKLSMEQKIQTIFWGMDNYF